MSLCLSRHLPVALGSFLTHNIFLLVARSMAGDQRDPPQLYLKKAATGDRPLKVLFWQAFYVFTGG